jgi:3-oxosteroid 1-dehydrogenase
MMLLYALDIPGRLKGPRNRRLALGAGLVGALRKSMMDRDIPLWLDTPFVSLIMEGGRAAGVVVRREGKEMRIAARRGVVLAAGGFERNQAMRDHYLPQPSKADWSATPPNNTGDAIRAGLDVGAAIAQMDRAWWVPSIHMPGRESQWGLFAERASPGSIIVNRLGLRFVDEAAPYLEFGEAMYADQRRTGANVPAWMIFDATFRHRYACGPLMPGSMRPDGTLPKDWLGKAYFRADSLAELAHQIGVDADGLAGTVERMNGYAVTGVDAEFHKGENIFDTYYGDPSVKPNPCLAPLIKPPFYALRIDPGDIGTKGGLVIDDNGQVQSTEGAPIPGLYAAGNTTSAVMGPAYPGPGSTLGPAMTFGFLAADHIAESSRN